MPGRHAEPKVVVLCCAVLVGGLGECVGGKPLGCPLGLVRGARLLMLCSAWRVRCLLLSVAAERSAGYFGLVFPSLALFRGRREWEISSSADTRLKGNLGRVKLSYLSIHLRRAGRAAGILAVAGGS